MEGENEVPGIEIDMDAAVADVAEGLGFEPASDEGADDDGLGDGETVTEEVAAPAAKPGDPAPAPAAADKAAAAAPTDPANPAAPADPLAAAPRTWRPEAAAEWANLSPTVKAEIAKREEDMFRGVEQYKIDAGVGKSFKQSIGKFIPLLQQHNIDPFQQVTGLMEAHQTLALGTPDQKLALFQRLAQDYGVDLATAAVSQPPYRDPEVERLQKEVQALKSGREEEQARQQAAARQAFERDVEQFSSDPKNVYFQELINDMIPLLEGGVARTIAEAYDKAAKLNPVVAAKEAARQQAEATKKAAEEAAKKAEEARRATAANVRSRARAGSAAAPVGSIDDTLNETYKAIMSR